MTGQVLKIAHQVGGVGPGLRSLFVLNGCAMSCRRCPYPRGGAREMTAEECAYTLFPYETTLRRGGGVTLAGGAVARELPFALEFFTLLKERGYHTALFTDGNYPEGEEDGVERLLQKTDTVLLDVKALTEEGYQREGGSLARVLAFLGFAEAAGVDIWLRMVIVPSENDREEAILRLKRMTEHLTRLEKIELVPAEDCTDETIERLQNLVI